METTKVNRIGEIVLTVIGILASIFGIIVAFGMSAFFKIEDFENEFVDEMATEGISAEESLAVLELFQSASTYFGIIAIISTIIGIVGTILFIGDKRSKAAGILLIIGAIIVLFASIGSGFFAFVFYLIAGIMGVVRKPPVPVDDYDFTTSTDDNLFSRNDFDNNDREN